MRERIVDLLEKVDAAIAESEGVIPSEDLSPISAARDLIRVRLSYPESVIVAGLVGGSGSGKSSLLNAVAGQDVADVGGVRPTTSAPLGLIPAVAAGAMSGYLDRMGIDEHVAASPHPWLCLIDLPDTDSVVVDHRLQVESLLPTLDVIIWVLDPEKYKDASTHGEIARLAEYFGQFVFVVNQADRLTEEDGDRLLQDLIAALEADGIPAPEPLLVAADPPAGPPIGVEGLVAVLGDRSHGNQAVYAKLLSDLDRASTALVASASGAGGLDFEERWRGVLDSLRQPIESGRVSEVMHVVTAFLDELATESGGPIGESLRRLTMEIPSLISGSHSAATIPPELPGRWRRRRSVERSTDRSPLPGDLLESLDDAIGGQARAMLRRRAASHAAIAALHLAVVQTVRGPS